MNRYCLVATSLLLGTSLWGQTAASPTIPPQPTQSGVQPIAPSHPTPAGEAQPLRIQTSHPFGLELEAMRVKLSAMKANAAKVKDPAMKKQIQLDAELWELVVSHMNELSLALVQVQRQRLSSLNPAAQTYRRQMLQGRMGTSPAGIPAATPVQPAAPEHP